jgi:hypothetical protein
MSTNQTNDQPAGEAIPLHAVNAGTAASNGHPTE